MTPPLTKSKASSAVDRLTKRKQRRLAKGALALWLGAAAFGWPAGQAAAATPLNVAAGPVVIDGQQTMLPTANVNGDTYVGLRILNERLGLETGWDEAQRLVTVRGHGRTIVVPLDGDQTVVNGQPLYGPRPIVQDGATYMPLRYMLERLGYGVSYEAATRTIGIETIRENELTVTTASITDGDEEQSLAVYYPQIAGLANAQAQQRINETLKIEAETHAAAGKEEIAKAAAANSQAEANNPSIQIPPVSFEGRYVVTSNEQGRLSLYVDYYSYLGGAHGMTLRVPYTFDLSDGHVLALQEAAGNRPDYVAIINEAIQRQLPTLEIGLLAPFETIEPDRAFFLKHEGLVIYFNQYEYTPYAAGAPEFVIPYSAFR